MLCGTTDGRTCVRVAGFSPEGAPAQWSIYFGVEESLQKTLLRLADTKAFPSGVAVHTYEPASAPAT
jgi:hypothetical protein